MVRSELRRSGRFLGYCAVALIAVTASTIAVGASAADSPTAATTQLIAIQTTIDPAPPGSPTGAPTTCNLTFTALPGNGSPTLLGTAAPACPSEGGPTGAVAFTWPYDPSQPGGQQVNVTSKLASRWTPFNAAQGPSGQGWITPSSTCRGAMARYYENGFNALCHMRAEHVDASLHVPVGFTHQSGAPISARRPRFVVTIMDSTFSPTDLSPCSDVVTLESLTVRFPACDSPSPPQSVTSIAIGLPDLSGLTAPSGHVDGFALSIASNDPDGILVRGHGSVPFAACGPDGGVGTSYEGAVKGDADEDINCVFIHYHSSNGLLGPSAPSK